MPLEPTADPHILIEERLPGYVRYRNDEGRRWEVRGVCDRRGHCMVGAVLADGTQIRDLEHLAELASEGRVPESDFDTPVSPEFVDCCPFTYVELGPAQ